MMEDTMMNLVNENEASVEVTIEDFDIEIHADDTFGEPRITSW